jgi:hypothetical protein
LLVQNNFSVILQLLVINTMYIEYIGTGCRNLHKHVPLVLYVLGYYVDLLLVGILPMVIIIMDKNFIITIIAWSITKYW